MDEPGLLKFIFACTILFGQDVTLVALAAFDLSRGKNFETLRS